MSNINIPVYVVREGCDYDESDDNVIGTYLSKEQAEKVLYKYVIDLSIELGDTIRRNEFDEERFNIGSSNYAYISIRNIEVK